MYLKIDLEGVLESLKGLPEEVDSLDAVAETSRALYAENEGRFQLNGADRDHLVQAVTKMAENAQLRDENKDLRDRQDRQIVVETVKANLLRVGVTPALLAGATALFLSQHKCAVVDGEVRVIGKLGAADAEMAAVAWATSDDGEVYVGGKRPSDGGVFAAEIAKLRGVH